jgi:chorismatase
MTSRVQSLPVLTPVFGTAAASTILGAIHYGTRHLGPRDDDGHPELTVQMVTEEADPFTEFWHTKGKVERGRRDGVVYAHDGEHFFCAGHVEESRSYTDAVRSAYLIA